MKKLILILMLGMVFGQDIDETLLNNTEKMILYHAERKNPSTAVIFEGFFPTAGYAYSGKWKEGLLHRSLSLGMIFGGLNNMGANGEGKRLVVLGSIYSIWILFDVAKKTRQYNDKLYNNIFGTEPPPFSLKLQPTYKGANLTMSYAFN